MAEKDTVTLKLKLRELDEPTVTVRVQEMKDLLATSQPRDALYTYFKNLEQVVEIKESIHDKVFLEQIINWTPEDGVSVVEQSKWYQLGAKISKVKEDKADKIELTSFQVNLIWSRLNNQDYKRRNFNVPWAEFMIDFQQATGKFFEGTDN